MFNKELVKRGFAFFTVLSFCGVKAQNAPMFSIVGSNTIKEGSDFQFSVMSQNLLQPLTANFSLSYTELDRKIIEFSEVPINSDEVQNFVFNTKELLPDQYTLHANIYDPSNHNFIIDRWPLQFLKKLYHIVIQTDKELYKGGNLMRFRLFAFDSDTRPTSVSTGSAVISIIDPNNITIHNITEFGFAKGGYSDNFQFTEFAAIGLWTIRVHVDDQIFEKIIDVQAYELPMFFASIEVPDSVAITDQSFQVKVSVDYTFGKTMHGVAVVKFLRYSYLEVYEKTLRLGLESGTFEVNIASDLGVTKEEQIDILLEFTDAMSDKVINSEAFTTIKTHSAVLKLHASDTFKRQSNFTFTLSAIRYDGLPAPQDTSVTVEILMQKECYQDESETDWICPEDIVTQIYGLDHMGIAKGGIATEDYSFISLQAYCTSCVTITHFAEVREVGFDMKVLGESHVINQAIEVELETVHEISVAFCYFLAKNVHLNLITVAFVDGFARFSFIPDEKYTPMTQITCVGVDNFGQRVESQTLVTLDQMPNHVDIEVLTPSVEPGMNGSIKITSSLNSIVSLVAIDKRLLSLQKSKGLGNPWTNLQNQIMQFSRDQSQNSHNFEMLRFLSQNEVTTTTDKLQTAPTEIPVTSPTLNRFSKRFKSPAVLPSTENDPRFRRNFAETFLWVDISIDQASESDPTQGFEVVTFETPDSISSYTIFAVAFGDIGAGVSENPPIMLTEKYFFIQFDLPYSIKQSETLRQTITVFNYLDVSQDSTLTVNHDVKFILEDPQWLPVGQVYLQNFEALESSINTFPATFRPLSSGETQIRVRAAGPLESDGIERTLRVLPDGIEREITHTEWLLKNETANPQVILFCDVPATVDAEKVTTQISFVGDLLGDALTNMANIIQMPAGCGEQNLARFSSTIITYIYLTSSGQMTPEIHQRIIDYIMGRQDLEGGFQKHLTLRLPDGSYLYFHKTTTPSTFLTAFSVKMFRQAQTFMTIDQQLIDTAMTFILSKQEADGGFYEDTTAVLYHHQGGLRDKTTLTAYIAVILNQLLETEANPTYAAARDRAITYIIQNAKEVNAYELAITCYALYFINHPSFSAKYQKLLTMAIETADIMYWDVQAGVVLNVETASYALLFMNKFDTVRSIKLAKYLISQKNPYGGWASTQDTVMAIESLATVAGLITAYDGNLRLSVLPDYDVPFYVSINENNKINQQTFVLDSHTREVLVVAQGTAMAKAIVSFTCRFFEDFDGIPPRFEISHELVEQCNTPLRSHICINYIADGDDQISNMVIMRMTMPSGYVFDSDAPVSDIIRRIDTENANTKIVAYFDSMTSEQVCFDITSFQTFDVKDTSGELRFLIEAIDYYSPEKKAETFFYISDDLRRCT